MVVVVGFLILAGAVNTSIVGANGVLNRVTEDGVLPDWLKKPQRTYGTTWRLLTLIAGLQVATIVLSGGNVILLGEAYAFGVIWSLVFKALSMLVLRFTAPDRYRGYRVPLNLRLGRRELPVGLALVFLVLLAAALANLMTKPVATVSGLAFAAIFLIAFAATEHSRERREGAEAESRRRGHEYLEQFEVQAAEELTPEALGLQRPDRKLVSVGSPGDLTMFETCLVETDPARTDIVVLAAHTAPAAGMYGDPERTDVLLAAARTEDAPEPPLGWEDRKLMTAIVNRSEVAGKPVKPAVILTGDPEAALIRSVRAVGAQELLLGASGSEPPVAQLDRLVARWQESSPGRAGRLTVRLITKDLDLRRDLDGGSRIPPAADDDDETARALAGSGAD
jgi:hypothetical protein